MSLSVILTIFSLVFFNFIFPFADSNFTYETDGKVLGAAEDNLDQAIVVKDKKFTIQPELKSENAAVISSGNNTLFFGREENAICPIASITKLMSALVFIDSDPDWEKQYKIRREDRRDGGKIFLFSGETVTLKDLFYLTLVGSDNTATIALASSMDISEQEFVKKMNSKALELGLSNTHFNDATGLSAQNVSTASEIAKLVKVALEKDEIREATLTKQYEFKTVEGKLKKVETTDDLLKNFPENGIKIVGGKTGYTEAAGYCFAGQFINDKGNKVISVVLGGDDANLRFVESKELAEWVFANFNFPTEE